MVDSSQNGGADDREISESIRHIIDDLIAKGVVPPDTDVSMVDIQKLTASIMEDMKEELDESLLFGIRLFLLEVFGEERVPLSRVFSAMFLLGDAVMPIRFRYRLAINGVESPMMLDMLLRIPCVTVEDGYLQLHGAYPVENVTEEQVATYDKIRVAAAEVLGEPLLLLRELHASRSDHLLEEACMAVCLWSGPTAALDYLRQFGAQTLPILDPVIVSILFAFNRMGAVSYPSSPVTGGKAEDNSPFAGGYDPSMN